MDVLVTTCSIHYNGVKAKQIKEARGKFTLQPKESKTIGLRIKARKTL